MDKIEDLLVLKDVTKAYKKKKRTKVNVVSNVNLKIRENEMFGIVGESGCGKSTLTRMILALEKADSGEILFEGKNFFNQDKKLLKEYRRNIQNVFQDAFSSLNPRMKIKNILAEPLKNYNQKYSLDILIEIIEQVGLDKEDLEKYPIQFSGGQRQRIAIARALALKPKCIIFDEPTSSLDVITEALILNLIRKINVKYGVGGIFISHNIRSVLEVCNRVAIMREGKILEIIDKNNIKFKEEYSKKIFEDSGINMNNILNKKSY